MKLYTKTGDDGTTGLCRGERVAKNDACINACGAVDELNAAIGVVLADTDGGGETGDMLYTIQSDLFTLGAGLATPTADGAPSRITDAHVARLEKWIDEACDGLPDLQNFVLPNGTVLAARLHLARTVSRRAERAVVTLAQQRPLTPATMAYVNRLSDLFFALARRANHRSGLDDIIWAPPRQ